MREILTIQLGQCGNQIGNEFWKRLAAEHGLSADGHAGTSNPDDRRDIFFSEVGDGRFVPRNFMIDLEPRVVSTILQSPEAQFYNRENVFMSSEGGGAGNNWALGYGAGKKIREQVLDKIEREIESTENLEGFFVCHSIAGGTGSGLGSYLLEQLKDRYPKKCLSTFSVFPNTDDASDVVVQPYNAVLSMERLARLSDMSVIYDNSSLNRIAYNELNIINPNLAQTNQLISASMAAVTSTLRFPGYMNTNFESIISTMVPFSKANMVTCSFAPFHSFLNGPQIPLARKVTLQDIVLRLKHPKHFMAGLDLSAPNCYVAALDIIRGPTKSRDTLHALSRIKEKNLMNFAPWGPSNYFIVSSSEHQSENEPRCGTMLSNHTGLSNVVRKITDQYDRLRRRNAFLEQYRREDLFRDNLDEFDRSREAAQNFHDFLLQMNSNNFPQMSV